MPNETIIDSNVTDVATIDGLEELWAETFGDPRICVAILDGPVDKSHPSLATANLLQLDTLVSAAADLGPASQHGTHVASVVFGQHYSQVKGIAPDCRGLIVPVFKDGVDGSITPCSQLDLARAITQAVEKGAQVINISGGEFSPSGSVHPFLSDAVNNCAARGVLIVSAAGNEGCDCLNIPGALPSVLAVGAMNSHGEPMDFSNWGEVYRTQGVLAPGENIQGASPEGGTVTNTGTSYATPIVSGIVALLLCIQVKHGLKPDLQAVRSAIINTAVGCGEQPSSDCRRLLAGRLNIKGAMSQVIGGIDIMTDSMKHIGVENKAAYRVKTKPASRNSVYSKSVAPSGCGCGCSEEGQCSCESGGQHLVYALGTLGYDFGTEARRDSIMQHMEPRANDPYNTNHLLMHLNKNSSEAAAIIWTLNLDSVPIYAIEGAGAFAGDVYRRLREFLKDQAEEKIERVSIPGYVSGHATLSTGQVVPIISPELRGMCSWGTDVLIDEVLKKFKMTKDKKKVVNEAITAILLRVYYEFRNLGGAGQERAINYIFTNIFSTAESIIDALDVFKDSLALDTIEAVESPICRHSSECWEVKLYFFDPENVLRPRKVYLITVDVSDVVPVTVGPVRSWFVR